MDRRVKSRRSGSNRRAKTEPVDQERREVPRRKVARRRQIDPTTCERDYNQDEIEFMHALDAYKRAAGRMFPTCSEILEVVRDLGYRRLSPEELAKIQPPPADASNLEQPALGEGGIESGVDESADNVLTDKSLDELEG